MDLRHLRYFIAVAEEGHITKAAERLGMQQPPLSQQIKMLEAELGFPVFRRLPRGVELTEGGKVFLRDAKAILADLEAATKRASLAALGMEGTISVGFTTSSVAHPYTPAILRAYRSAYPLVVLQVGEGNAAELTAKVTEGKLDVALVRAPVASPAGMAFHTILQEPILLVLPVDHRLATNPETADVGISLRELQNEDFILVRQSGASGMYSELIAACQNAGFVPNIIAEIGKMLTNISMVAAGLGISIVPASMRGFHSNLVAYRSLRDAPELTAPMTLIYRENQQNIAAKNFVGLVKDTQSNLL